MKKIMLITAVTLAFAACNNTSNSAAKNAEALDTTKLASGAVFYQCPMDPEEMSDKPGTCSKCGMDLEKVEKK